MVIARQATAFYRSNVSMRDDGTWDRKNDTYLFGKNFGDLTDLQFVSRVGDLADVSVGVTVERSL